VRDDPDMTLCALVLFLAATPSPVDEAERLAAEATRAAATRPVDAIALSRRALAVTAEFDPIALLRRARARSWRTPSRPRAAYSSTAPVSTKRPGSRWRRRANTKPHPDTSVGRSC
jgi:hypothetical protein